MRANGWAQRVQKWRGGGAIETDLTSYRQILEAVNRAGERLTGVPDSRLRQIALSLRSKAKKGASFDDLLVDGFALVREAADRVLGMRPFDVQVMAGAALHRGKLVEMQTGEGKTLAAVLPACLNALTGEGVHILTFNDYLARRDAAWMGPVYAFLGLTVAAIQQGMTIPARRAAYEADVTYTTAKEAGFDFLRMHLCRDPDALVHRPFAYAIIDEADSILIDEARVPLVIAGDRPASPTNPYDLAALIASLEPDQDWETDEHERNVLLTDQGLDRVEEALHCGDLHQADNFLLLTEVNQALHARVLLHRDVDYIVRDGRIGLVDEFTGRVVEDRRWPDGLQAALEAKEGLSIQPGGHLLGSITVQHFLAHYPRLSGMTATAQAAAEELDGFYGLKVVPIPSNTPCIRDDQPDRLFTHQEAKYNALVAEIRREHQRRRPVLVGTSSVAESEHLAQLLGEAGIGCQVLNAKNNETEADIIAQAGALGAVTISTNMAGRGTDIKLGGLREEEREQVVHLGGLYVIGTNRHESRRIDDQLRGRAGRQGDHGTSRFFISLDDDLMVRFGIDELIPKKFRPDPQEAPIDHPVLRREVERLQRIVEGQNHEIRKTLLRYSSWVEKQRKTLHEWRMAVLLGEALLDTCSTQSPERYASLCKRFGTATVDEAERIITLHHLDQGWAEHLAFVAHLREGIHLVGLGGQDPLHEFCKQVAEQFRSVHPTIEARTAETFATIALTQEGIDLDKAGLRGPSSTWTYLINDRALSDLQQMLLGPSNNAFGAVAVLTTWPILAVWGFWRWMKRRKK